MTIPPDVTRLSPTVMSAELLRGTVVRCGPGLRGVGWPEDPRVRSFALRGLIDPSEDLVAVLTTAAWVWGACESPHPRQTFSTMHGARYLRMPASGIRVHEFLIAERDVVVLGPATVTSPLRTLYDLLYLDDQTYEDTGFEAARSLCEMWHPQRSFLGSFHARNRPHSVRAHDRYDEIVGLR